jgi:aldehyde:ferredoxin oxidoreductase
MSIGKKAIHQLRVFNLRHGLKRELERPSPRYGSVPSDGPIKGKGIMPVWDVIVKNYYTHMGWDPKTGKPLPETLSFYDLDHLIPDL